MKKEKANPKKPSLDDLQGHSYQHELGDPDAAEQLNKKNVRGKGSAKRGKTSDASTDGQTSHGMNYQRDKAAAGKPSNVKLPGRQPRKP